MSFERKRPQAVLAALAASVIAACSPVEATQEAAPATSAQADNSVHPISGLKVVPVTVQRGDRTLTFKTELAITPEEQAKGMMFRNEMADDEAMLFPSKVPARRSFWMKNTPLALDIIFIGVDGRISNIEAGVPYNLESVFSQGEVIAVFEIRGGLAEEQGIVPGDKVMWPEVK